MNIINRVLVELGMKDCCDVINILVERSSIPFCVKYKCLNCGRIRRVVFAF